MTVSQVWALMVAAGRLEVAAAQEQALRAEERLAMALEDAQAARARLFAPPDVVVTQVAEEHLASALDAAEAARDNLIAHTEVLEEVLRRRAIALAAAAPICRRTT